MSVTTLWSDNVSGNTAAGTSLVGLSATTGGTYANFNSKTGSIVSTGDGFLRFDAGASNLAQVAVPAITPTTHAWILKFDLRVQSPTSAQGYAGVILGGTFPWGFLIDTFKFSGATNVNIYAGGPTPVVSLGTNLIGKTVPCAIYCYDNTGTNGGFYEFYVGGVRVWQGCNNMGTAFTPGVMFQYVSGDQSQSSGTLAGYGVQFGNFSWAEMNTATTLSLAIGNLTCIPGIASDTLGPQVGPDANAQNSILTTTWSDGGAGGTFQTWANTSIPSGSITTTALPAGRGCMDSAGGWACYKPALAASGNITITGTAGALSASQVLSVRNDAVFLFGNSQFDGIGSQIYRSFAAQLSAMLPGNFAVKNLGITGQTWAQLIGWFPTALSPLLSIPKGKKIVVLHEWYNSQALGAATMAAQAFQLAVMCYAAGATAVILSTPIGTGTVATMQAAAALVRAQWRGQVHGIVDYNADALIGMPNGVAAVGGIATQDNTHLTEYAQGRQAALTAQAINAILPDRVGPRYYGMGG